MQPEHPSNLGINHFLVSLRLRGPTHKVKFQAHSQWFNPLNLIQPQNRCHSIRCPHLAKGEHHCHQLSLRLAGSRASLPLDSRILPELKSFSKPLGGR
jgi:hypothetical protein